MSQNGQSPISLLSITRRHGGLGAPGLGHATLW